MKAPDKDKEPNRLVEEETRAIGKHGVATLSTGDTVSRARKVAEGRRPEPAKPGMTALSLERYELVLDIRREKWDYPRRRKDGPASRLQATRNSLRVIRASRIAVLAQLAARKRE